MDGWINLINWKEGMDEWKDWMSEWKCSNFSDINTFLILSSPSVIITIVITKSYLILDLFVH